MPLTTNQITTIESSISHLFTSTDAAAQRYKEMFFSEFKPATEDERITYDQLKKMIDAPEEFFGRLENENPDITLGEVVVAVAKHATKAINWKEEEIITRLKEKMGTVLFSAKYIYNNSLAMEEEKASYNSDEYVHQIQFERTTKKHSEGKEITEIHMQLSINFGVDQEYKESINITPTGDIDEAKLYEQKAEVAKELAGKNIMMYWIANLQKNKFANKLLALKYYYQLLQRDTTFLLYLTNMTEDRYNVLSAKEVLRLFEENIITPNFAAAFINPPLLSIIKNSFYHAQFLNRTLKIEDFPNVTPELSRILISFAVIQLIILKIITLDQAKKLTSAHLEFLENEYYFNLIKEKKLTHFFKDGNFNFDLFISQKQNQLLNLCLPIMIHFLNQGVSLEACLKFKFNKTERSLLKTTLVTELLKLDKITLDKVREIKNVTPAGLDLLNHLPFLDLMKTIEIDLSVLVNVTEEQSSNLKTKLICYFLQEKQLSFDAAKQIKMTGPCRIIFNEDIIVNYAKSNPLDYQQFLRMNETQASLFDAEQITEGSVELKAMLIILKNKVLAELADNNDLEINDVLLIPPSSTYPNDPKFITHLYTHTGHIIKEAIILAKEGLLFEADFSSLYELVSDEDKIQSLPDSDDMNEDKKPVTASILLTNHYTKPLVSKRINERLTWLQEDKPFVFPDGTKDTILGLMKSLLKFPAMTAIDWGDVYAARLLRLYQNKPYPICETRSDSFDAVKEDLSAILTTTKIPAEKFYDHLLESLLMTISDNLLTLVKSGKTELRSFYLRVKAEINAGGNFYGLEAKPWQSCFENIALLAEERLETLGEKNDTAKESKTAERPAKMQRTSLTLFTPATAPQISLIEDTCQNLLKLVTGLRTCGLISSAADISSSLGLGLSDETGNADRKRKTMA